jgi:hypothetical protein
VTALATADDLEKYLGHPPANPDQATWYLDAASAFARSYCQWSISYEADVEWTLDGPGGCLLALPTLHLIAVTALSVNDELVDPAELELSQTGLVVRRCGWPHQLGGIVAVATHGYSETPRDVTAVVCSAASRMLGGAGKGSVTTERVGGVQVTWGREGAEASALSKTEVNALDRYKLPGIS